MWCICWYLATRRNSVIQYLSISTVTLITASTRHNFAERILKIRRFLLILLFSYVLLTYCSLKKYSIFQETDFVSKSSGFVWFLFPPLNMWTQIWAGLKFKELCLLSIRSMQPIFRVFMWSSGSRNAIRWVICFHEDFEYI